MKKILFIIIIATIFVSCGVHKLYFPTYDENNLKTELNEYGWNVRIEPNDSLSPFVNKWYSKHLNSLKEPIIYNQSKNILRFTLLGTWSNPVSYRLEQKGGKASITYNKTNGQGGYEAGVRVEHKTKKIDKEKWDIVVSKLDSINFWIIETHDKNMILDGEEWIFEVFINGRYHFVTRNSPDHYDGKDYAELCNLIVQIYNENK